MSLCCGRRLGLHGQLELQPADVLAEPADIAVEMPYDAVAEHEALEQRVRGEPVGAVHAGAGDFAGGVEAGHGGAAPDVCDHTADEVVRHGSDRDEVAAQVELVLGQQGGHSRETLTQHVGVEPRRIEVDVRRALARHLGEHAAHHDVARRELGFGVDRGHETLAGGVAQQSAFAAQRFGHERRRRAADGQAGRMELDELEVADGGAGTIGHRHAVAGSDLGIGRAGIDLPGPAGGEDGDHGQIQRVLAVGEVEREGADAAPVDGQQIDGELVLVELHAAADPSRLRQGAGDLAAGGVAAGVGHPADGVRALAAEHDLAVLAIEPRADLDQLAHAVGALVHEHPDGFGVAQTRAGVDRVLKVQVGGVGFAQGGGDAALGEEGRGVVQAGLGQQTDVPAPRGGDRRREAGNAAAEHEHVELAAHQRPRRQARDVGTRHGGHPLAGRRTGRG